MFKCTVQQLLVPSQCCTTTTAILLHQNIFTNPKENPVPVKQSLPMTPSQPLGTPHMLSVSMDLPILGSPYRWNHTVWDLLCPASFTQHNVFKGHPCCYIYQYFIHNLFIQSSTEDICVVSSFRLLLAPFFHMGKQRG